MAAWKDTHSAEWTVVQKVAKWADRKVSHLAAYSVGLTAGSTVETTERHWVATMVAWKAGSKAVTTELPRAVHWVGLMDASKVAHWVASKAV